jgi:UDP-glucose 4-epimerase
VLAPGSGLLDLAATDACERYHQLALRPTKLIVAARSRPKATAIDTFLHDLTVAAGVARIIRAGQVSSCTYFSSTAVYGDAQSNLDITEQTPLTPSNLYGTTKVAAEQLIQHSARHAGVPVLILRPCMIYGPNDPSTAYGPARFLRTMVEQQRVEIFGDGQELRDYLYIRDLVDITLALTFGGAEGIYNLAAGQAFSFQELLNHLRALFLQPFTVVSLARDRPETDQRVRIDKLKARLSELEFTPLAQGLAETFAAFTAATRQS